MGDAYLHITKGDTVLEIIMGEKGLYYRTKKGNQYGTNNFPCGFGRAVRADMYTEIKLSGVIMKFVQQGYLQGDQPADPVKKHQWYLDR